MRFTITARPSSNDFTVHRHDRMITPNSRHLRFSNGAAAWKWVDHFYPKAEVDFA